MPNRTQIPLAKQLRAKVGKTMLAWCGCKGLSDLPGPPCAIWSKAEEAVVLSTLQGKGLCGKEAFLLT